MIRTRHRWPGMPGPLRTSPLACPTCGATTITTWRTTYKAVAPGIAQRAGVEQVTVCLTCEPPR